MGCQRTDCIEKPLSNLFEKFGRIVGTYPVWFFVITLIVSGILGGGFYFLKDREDNDIERQFTPRSGPSKIARAFVKENFPNDDTEFSSQRLYEEGNYASIIMVSNDKSNILTTENLKNIIKVNNKVIDISVDVDQRELRFSHLCAKTNGHCVSNEILEMIDFNASRIEQTNITFPLYTHKSRQLFLGSAIGGVQANVKSEVKSAKAVKLFYFLESHTTRAEAWLKEFQRILSDERDNENIKVSYYTSQSKQEEIEKHTTDGIPLFSTTYSLAIAFSVISCLRLDNVRNKVWVAAIGVLSAGLAVLSSFGLMFYIGMPFVITVVNCPFLILGIGVDDMFIMVSNWQQTNVKDPVEKRMAHTYKEAAMSITITTLTDVLGFYIGLMSDFLSVQYFCLYTSTAVIFCYIYNITFFGAFLALNGRRERSNRHWLTCMKIPSENPKECSNGYSMCCVGGNYDKATGTEKEQPINHFFKKYYGPFLTKPWTKVIVIFIYAGYLAASIYGCFQIQQGIDLRDLAADDSYVIPYYDNDRQYFSTYGPNVMVIVSEKFPYWDKNKRSELLSCMEDFKKLQFITDDLYTSWLDYYEGYARSTHLNIDDEIVFSANLFLFLNLYPDFKQDVNFTSNAIHASRFFIQTVNIVNASMEIEMVNSLKETAESCSVVPLIVYHPAFIYYDQYAVIVSGTLQNIGVTTAVMLIIALLLIPNPLCCLWVTFSIVSVIVGVTGFMALWDVNLDSISMIILVVCIGFTVDFSAHISYAFVSCKKSSVNERIVDALFTLGYPIVQGASSTILGVVVLAASKNHIFRTFFKIMFLVMLFGLIHGITFLPVFLTLFTRNSEKQKSDLKKDFKSGVMPQMKLDKKCVACDNKVFVTDNFCNDKHTICTQKTHICVIQNKNNLSHTIWATDPDCP
ncbi:patched domain-containing protein 3-like isoform X1 [Salmo trutta]|nr:patched domain-containing protein 3-like isoform X1 [Salmo trutta]